jgi:hypothetical protein
MLRKYLVQEEVNQMAQRMFAERAKCLQELEPPLVAEGDIVPPSSDEE